MTVTKQKKFVVKNYYCYAETRDNLIIICYVEKGKDNSIIIRYVEREKQICYGWKIIIVALKQKNQVWKDN